MDNLAYFFSKVKIFENIRVFHPYNNLKIIWDMIHFIIILVLLFLIPINVCFKIDLECDFKIFLLCFFIGDIVMNMNTGYFNKGFLVKKRKNIFLHYLKTEFFLDLFTLIIYVIDLKDIGHFIMLKLIFFLRWKKIDKINSKLQEKFKISLNFHKSFIDLINLLFFSFYILNIFACFWYYVARINESKENTWIHANGLTNESLFDQYVYAFYWSVVTIMTVGYGDISAENISEITFSIFTIFFGCGLFAYFINSIGSIAQEINKESHIFRFFFSLKKNSLIFRVKMGIINKYMEKKGIDYNLQMRVREYLRFIWQEESTQDSELEDEIISKLSKSLRSELMFESYGKILRNSPLFFANFSEKFLSELMYEIKEVRNIPEDILFSVIYLI